MATATESRFVMTAKHVIADILARLPAVEGNPFAAADVAADVQFLRELVQEAARPADPLDPFEPAQAPALTPPS